MIKIPQFSLFLDRDGVINEAVSEDYIKNWKEFKFKPDFIAHFPKICGLFAHIIVITNQQGVAKGLMSEADLEDIHRNMQNEIINIGGRIDKIYSATNLSTTEPNFRKPNIWLALQAKLTFKQIDFNKSIMVGDNSSDMQFAKNTGMKSVLMKSLHNENKAIEADFVTSDWLHLSNHINKLFIL